MAESWAHCCGFSGRVRRFSIQQFYALPPAGAVTALSPPKQTSAQSELGELIAQALRHHATVLGELLHHRPMQCDILFRAAVGTRMDIEFVSELLACSETGIEVQ